MVNGEKSENSNYAEMKNWEGAIGSPRNNYDRRSSRIQRVAADVLYVKALQYKLCVLVLVPYEYVGGGGAQHSS